MSCFVISRKKKKLKRSVLVFGKYVKQKRLTDSYVKWRRLYLFEKNSAILIARSIIDIKNALLVWQWWIPSNFKDKYFKCLKRRWYFKKIIEYQTIEREQKIKKDVLKSLRKLIIKKKMLKLLAIKFEKQNSLSLKKKYLYVLLSPHLLIL